MGKTIEIQTFQGERLREQMIECQSQVIDLIKEFNDLKSKTQNKTKEIESELNVKFTNLKMNLNFQSEEIAKVKGALESRRLVEQRQDNILEYI